MISIKPMRDRRKATRRKSKRMAGFGPDITAPRPHAKPGDGRIQIVHFPARMVDRHAFLHEILHYRTGNQFQGGSSFNLDQAQVGILLGVMNDFRVPKHAKECLHLVQCFADVVARDPKMMNDHSGFLCRGDQRKPKTLRTESNAMALPLKMNSIAVTYKNVSTTATARITGLRLYAANCSLPSQRLSPIV
jgi:hypothetical protein